MKYILAIDQGTSSTKTIIFDENGDAVSKGSVELKTNYFENGFVEQDAEEIYQNVLDSVNICIENFIKKGLTLENIVSCGISNQRETFVLFDKNGIPQAPAVVWACKRSVNICQKLKANVQEKIIQLKTGLILDPYFSGTKLLWLIENDDKLKEKLSEGKLYFGTIDTWLLYKFTKGKSFKTDYTNASRTLLFNIHTLKWDDEILKLWGLEKLNLPEACPSSYNFGKWILDFGSNKEIPNPKFELPIQSLIGDSHAAAFGEACFEAGTAKVTLGTGSSILMNIGEKPVLSKTGMLTTICWSTENTIAYALEGAIVSCGSTIEWVKNTLGLFDEVADTESIAYAVTDNGGVYFIPAFSGMGAPHWQMDRKASIEGMTFGTTKNHIVRAALESVAYQIKDVLVAMVADLHHDLNSISVNGGLSANKFILNILVDLIKIPLLKQSNTDVSALGAAFLSGLKSGVYHNMQHIRDLNAEKTEKIEPNFLNNEIDKSYDKWVSLIKSY